MAHLFNCVVCGHAMASDADCCPNCGSKERPKRPMCPICDDERKVYDVEKLIRYKKFFGWSEWRLWHWTGLISRKQKDRENFVGEINEETRRDIRSRFSNYDDAIYRHQFKIGNIREEICPHCSRFYESK